MVDTAIPPIQSVVVVVGIYKDINLSVKRNVYGALMRLLPRAWSSKVSSKLSLVTKGHQYLVLRAIDGRPWNSLSFGSLLTEFFFKLIPFFYQNTPFSPILSVLLVLSKYFILVKLLELRNLHQATLASKGFDTFDPNKIHSNWTYSSMKTFQIRNLQ